MPQLGQLSAWVSVNGVESSEYAVEHSPDGKQVTCWVASEAGKNFAVSWKASYPSFSYLPFSHRGILSVDGTKCASRILRQASTHNHTTMKGIDTSPTTQRPLLFSKMELTDDDAFLHTATADLGEIKLELSEVAVLSSKLAQFGTKAPQLQQKVHERSKKGSAHCVKFGAETPQRHFITTTTRAVRHLGTFIFKYRPLEILQANGIAPINKKRKQAAAISNDILDLTQDDAEEPAPKEIVKLEARTKKAKHAHEPSKTIKTEVKNEPRNIWLPGEIIDLT